MGFATDFSVTVYCDFCKGQTEEITCMNTTSLAKAWTYAKKRGWKKSVTSRHVPNVPSG